MRIRPLQAYYGRRKQLDNSAFAMQSVISRAQVTGTLPRDLSET